MPLALLKNWKLIVALLGMGALFAAGWHVNGWRLNAKYERTQAGIAAAYAEATQQMLREHAQEVQRREQISADLRDDLEESAARVAALLSESATAQMSAESDVIRAREEALLSCRREETPDGPVEIHRIVANPIGDNFVRLWNESAAGPRPGAP